MPQVETPIGTIDTDTSTQTQAHAPTTTPVSNPKHSTSDYFKAVNLIRDGSDLVDSDFTNRPHKEIIANLTNLANIADVTSLDSLGEWQRNRTYKKGDIVSFLSEYFVSLQDTNQNNIPIPSSALKDSAYWKAIANIKDIEVNDFIYKEGEDNLTLTPGYSPLTNGRPLRFFDLESGKKYTLFMMTRGNPFKEQFAMYFDFECKRNADFANYSADVSMLADLEVLDSAVTLPSCDDPNYPVVSYIECEVHYTGLKYSQSGVSLPTIRFLNVNDSLISRSLDLSAKDKVYDAYGHYGVIFQSCLRNDGLVAVTVIPKWDCRVVIAGRYNMSPYFSDETGSVTSNSRVAINYRVRPFGGDNGEAILYPYYPALPLTAKQAWDLGLVKLSDLGVSNKATSTVTFTLDQYPRVLYMSNQFNFDGDVDSSKDAGYNYTKVDVDLSKCFASDTLITGDKYIKLF